MLAQVLWWSTNLLEGAILWRGIATGLLRRYAFFYSYLVFILVESAVRLIVFHEMPERYSHVYWYTQTVSAVFGYVVLWGICAYSLSSYPGAARMGRWLFTILFVLLVTRVIAVASTRDGFSLPATAAEFERDVRGVQAILLVVMLLIYMYYRVPLNANLRGILLGYGFYISVSVMVLASQALLVESHGLMWRYLQPSAYAAALCIWCGFLWFPAAVRQPLAKAPIELGYEALAGNTARFLARLRLYLVRAVRP